MLKLKTLCNKPFVFNIEVKNGFNMFKGCLMFKQVESKIRDI